MKNNTDHATLDHADANRDPMTKEEGSHPVGTGLGAAGAGTAGMLVGTGLAGPIGGVVGAALGATVGGALGHYAAEAANPTYVAVEPHLREQFPARPYATGHRYEDFEDAYVFGIAERTRLGGPWSPEHEDQLRSRWNERPPREGFAKMDWDHASPAIRDGWNASDY